MKKFSGKLSVVCCGLVFSLLVQPLSPSALASSPNPREVKITATPPAVNGEAVTPLEFEAGVVDNELSETELRERVHLEISNGSIVSGLTVTNGEDTHHAEVGRSLAARAGLKETSHREIPVKTKKGITGWFSTSTKNLVWASATLVAATGIKYFTLVLSEGVAPHLALKTAVAIGVLGAAFVSTNERWREEIQKSFGKVLGKIEINPRMLAIGLAFWVASDFILVFPELALERYLGIVHTPLVSTGLWTMSRNLLAEFPLDFFVIAQEWMVLAAAAAKDQAKIKLRYTQKVLTIAALGEVLTTLQLLNFPGIYEAVYQISFIAWTGLAVTLFQARKTTPCTEAVFMPGFQMSPPPETLDPYFKR